MSWLVFPSLCVMLFVLEAVFRKDELNNIKRPHIILIVADDVVRNKITLRKFRFQKFKKHQLKECDNCHQVYIFKS